MEINPISTLSQGTLQRQMSQPSPTINTKEAQMVMQEMWGCPSATKLSNDVIIGKVHNM